MCYQPPVCCVLLARSFASHPSDHHTHPKRLPSNVCLVTELPPLTTSLFLLPQDLHARLIPGLHCISSDCLPVLREIGRSFIPPTANLRPAPNKLWSTRRTDRVYHSLNHTLCQQHVGGLALATIQHIHAHPDTFIPRLRLIPRRCGQVATSCLSALSVARPPTARRQLFIRSGPLFHTPETFPLLSFDAPFPSTSPLLRPLSLHRVFPAAADLSPAGPFGKQLD